MGKYINYNSNGTLLSASFKDKFKELRKDGAKEIDEPKQFMDNLVLLGDNGGWGFAAYIYSINEFESFREDIGNRKHKWLKYEHAKDTAR